MWGDRNLVLTKASDRQNPVVDLGGAGRFLHIQSGVVDTTSIIRGFTVMNGLSPDPSTGGGAIRVTPTQRRGPSPIIELCDFALNQAVYGGAIEAINADLVVRSCLFRGNSGDYGDSLPANHHDNLFRDPLFCDAGSDDFTVCEDSPAIPDFNPWGVEIGFTSFGCPPCDTPVVKSAWGSIKALYR